MYEIQISERCRDISRDPKVDFRVPNSAHSMNYLERALREDRRPLAGMFRVRVVPGNCCRDVLHDGIRSCSGTLGVAFGMQTILRGMRGANFNALRGILKPFGAHLRGALGRGSGAVLGPSRPL